MSGAAKKATKNTNPVAFTREVCRVIYFDASGKFTKNPKKASSVKSEPVKPKQGRGYKLYKSAEVVDIDGKPGGPTATITRRGNRYVVTLRDPSLEAEKIKAKARGEVITLEAIRGYERDLKRMVLRDYLGRQKAQKDSAALERSFKSDLARKGARTQAARKQALTPEQRKQAQNQATALETRLNALEGELARDKTQKQKETLRNRKRRWTGALDQLNKIAAGRAYKFTTAASTR